MVANYLCKKAVAVFSRALFTLVERLSSYLHVVPELVWPKRARRLPVGGTDSSTATQPQQSRISIVSNQSSSV